MPSDHRHEAAIATGEVVMLHSLRSSSQTATKNHHVQTAAGRIPVRLDLGPADPVLLTVRKTKVTATCLASGCSGSKVTGVVTAQQINNTLIPQMVAIFRPLALMPMSRRTTGRVSPGPPISR